MLGQINSKILVEYLQNRNWIEFCNVIDENFKINSNVVSSSHVTPDMVIELSDSLHLVPKLLTNQDDNYFKITKHIYKALRNSVAYNPDIQKLVSISQTILKDTVEVLKCLKSNEQQGWDCIKMLLQFLINLIINNEATSKEVWGIFKNDLKELIKNNICLYHTSALVYNIFHNNLLLMEEDVEIVTYIFDSYKQNNTNEYLTFLLELYIKDVNLNKTYINYSVEHQMLCLEMMKEMWNTDKAWMTEELLIILSTQFKQKSDCILKTVTDYLKQVEPFEVTLLLELLASVSSDENFVKHLQKDKSLLINCAFLLKSIHSVGKEADNNFSIIPKLSQLENTDLEILQHPAYGFKASIIRLLANMCWKHKLNQDEIRELDCLPLLLDCCNIDARNPFIIQWVIFAIRNLCEKNIENQRVLAAMNKKGVVSSATLLEMGITLHSDDQHTIKIAPLNLNE